MKFLGDSGRAVDAEVHSSFIVGRRQSFQSTERALFCMWTISRWPRGVFKSVVQIDVL